MAFLKDSQWCSSYCIYYIMLNKNNLKYIVLSQAFIWKEWGKLWRIWTARILTEMQSNTTGYCSECSAKLIPGCGLFKMVRVSNSQWVLYLLGPAWEQPLEAESVMVDHWLAWCWHAAQSGGVPGDSLAARTLVLGPAPAPSQYYPGGSLSHHGDSVPVHRFVLKVFWRGSNMKNRVMWQQWIL